MDQNTGPQKPKTVAKYLAENFAVMLSPDGNRRETVPVGRISEWVSKGWRRVN